jgi:hypothetical protein
MLRDKSFGEAVGQYRCRQHGFPGASLEAHAVKPESPQGFHDNAVLQAGDNGRRLDGR